MKADGSAAVGCQASPSLGRFAAGTDDPDSSVDAGAAGAVLAETLGQPGLPAAFPVWRVPGVFPGAYPAGFAKNSGVFFKR